MKRWISAVLLVSMAVSGCGGHAKPEPTAPPPSSAPGAPEGKPALPEPEPERITVQHVLIAFKGAAQAPPEVTRTKEEAATFAREILERVRKGEDIAELAAKHSTDSPPGKYTLVNAGVPLRIGEIPRAKFIKAFVDLSFKLKVGESGIVDYDKYGSPYGWHIIKRLE